ncbi:MAG: hypothetical protein GXN91_02870 [Epsilonproteobacteria bacterium]|nr:hypothetical protein [Campylobacterota bacterium]
MELYIAREAVNANPTKKITLEEIEKRVQNDERFFYLDRENEHKTLNELLEYFENKGYTPHLQEVRYALGDLDYIYELHIV